MRQVVIYPSEHGYSVVECASLPGRVSRGKTKEEAIASIKQSVRGHIVALEEDGLAVPKGDLRLCL